ncbi:MAG: hypothetical protein UY36_C0003G0004 [Parcubacteria group bacterium GW2011_GWA1_49_11]|nr:MAG: hypothetical protein UY36_C0003G0004 [Parcubacteria group bacterium GW2011_GWA1_49_11]
MPRRSDLFFVDSQTAADARKLVGDFIHPDARSADDNPAVVQINDALGDLGRKFRKIVLGIIAESPDVFIFKNQLVKELFKLFF